MPRARTAPSRSLRRSSWNTVLILLNGEVRDAAAVRRLVRAGAALLCADGGVRSAARLGLVPRVVIGDMDSLPPRLPRWPKTVYLCDFDENASDFEKCLRFAVRRGVRKAWVAGAFGARFDHELVNLALIETYSAALDLELPDVGARVLGPGRHAIACRKRDRVTLLPATPRAAAATTGLRWALSGERLRRASRGLGNVALARTVRVDVRSGRLWVVSSAAR